MIACWLDIMTYYARWEFVNMNHSCLVVVPLCQFPELIKLCECVLTLLLTIKSNSIYFSFAQIFATFNTESFVIKSCNKTSESSEQIKKTLSVPKQNVKILNKCERIFA